MYVVIVCSRCAKLLLAKADSKTRHCPYCQTRLVLTKTKAVASAKTAQEALVLIQALKRRKREDIGSRNE
jgi:DNA-directed RNA polymerase subunit RPC12/RpoP